MNLLNLIKSGSELINTSWHVCVSLSFLCGSTAPDSRNHPKIIDPKQTQFVANLPRKSRDDDRSALIGRERQAVGHAGEGYLAFWDTNSGRYEELQQRQQQQRPLWREGDERNNSQLAEEPLSASSYRTSASFLPPCCPGEADEEASHGGLVSEMQRWTLSTQRVI